MKILIYENSSGLSSYTSKLCEAICESGNYEIDYLTIQNNKYLTSACPRIRVVPKLKTYNKRKKKSLLWLLNRIYVSLFNIRQRGNLCKNNRYDVVSIQETIPIFDQFFIKNFCKKNKNVVYTVHDVVPPIKSLFWSKKSLKKVYSSVDKLIVHTEGNKKQLMDFFGIQEEKICVINHGTDEKYNKLQKSQCKRVLGLNVNKVVILFYGMIRDQKGLDILIESMNGIDNVQLFVAGALPFGETFKEYDTLICKNSIDVFKMVHFIPEEETDIIFNSCDLVCLPYKYFYSQSGVFMKAIKYRKPIIASDVSSFRDYFKKYNIGAICKPNNVSDLRNKIWLTIKLLKSNPSFFYKELDRAAKENSWAISAHKYILAFEKR